MPALRAPLLLDAARLVPDDALPVRFAPDDELLARLELDDEPLARFPAELPDLDLEPLLLA